MNKKPKTEQIFILLVLLMICFITIAMIGCGTTPIVERYGELYTCGKNGCIGCGVTCGTISGAHYWDCSKDTGCLRYYTGCGRKDDETQLGFGFGCEGCFGCLISGSSCDNIKGGLSCGGCVIGDTNF
jgi:hypothetical protein